MSTSVAGVTTNFFPDAENGFTTTLASTISSGATTVPLNSVAGYTNGMPVVFVVDPSDLTKKQTFTGIIDTAGVQVTNVVWTAGTNQSHAGGATVVDYVTATHMAMVTKGLTTAIFDQDGTMKAGAVDNAAALGPDVVTTAKIIDSAVTAPKLATSALFLGYTQITSDFTTTSTTFVAVTGLSASVTIPAGSRRTKITVYTAGLYSSSTTIGGLMTLWDGTVGSGTQLQLAAGFGNSAAGGATTPATLVWVGTPAAGAKTYNVGLRVPSAATGTIAASSTSPAFILVEAV